MRKFRTSEMRIRIGNLNSGMHCQREVTDTERIQCMVDNWNWALYQPICVSLLDGKYYVIDGQHRVAALKQIYGDDFKTTCKLATDLTLEEQNEWFAELATNEKAQSLKSVVTAKIHSKAYPEYQELVDDLRKAGLNLKLTNKGKQLNAIRANAAIIKLHNQMSKPHFIECMSILKDLWNGNSSSLTASFLEGWSYFYSLYHNQWDIKTLFSKLSIESASQISKHAKSLADLKTYTLQQCYAKEFVTLYNGRSRKYRLDDTVIKSPTNI